MDAQQLRPRIIIVLVSLDIEKSESGFAVAHGKIECCAERKLIYYELAKRRDERRRQIVVAGAACPAVA